MCLLYILYHIYQASVSRYVLNPLVLCYKYVLNPTLFLSLYQASVPNVPMSKVLLKAPSMSMHSMSVKAHTPVPRAIEGSFEESVSVSVSMSFGGGQGVQGAQTQAQGVQGVPGPQGVQGVQGVQRVQGAQEAQGAAEGAQEDASARLTLLDMLQDVVAASKTTILGIYYILYTIHYILYTIH
jgi:hypothetical protein